MSIKAKTHMEADGSRSFVEPTWPHTTWVRVEQGFTYKDVKELRKPPFTQIIPCPYCGSLNEWEHMNDLHIDVSRGVPNADE